jgi:hypothetical protein
VEPLLDVISALLVEHLDLRDCWFEAFPFDTQLPRIEPGRIMLPEPEPGLAPWALDNGVELPVRYGALTVGRFVLVPRTRTTGTAFDPELRAAALELMGPVAAAVALDLRASELSR